MEERKRRFPWMLSLLGLLLGLAAGLGYAWFLNPVNFVNIAPDRLSADDQREYILLISEAYLQERDIDRARQRLSGLGVRNITEVVSIQADSALLRGAEPEEVRALAALAEALGASPLAVDIFSGTVMPTTPAADGAGGETPVPTRTLTQPATPSPTPALEPATATPDPASQVELSLSERLVICEDDYPLGRIEVYVFNAFENGIPAVEIVVTWDEGQDVFFTGLKPEIDPGYADFEMEGDRLYTVTLVGRGEPVVGIDSSACQTPGGRTSIPSYRLTFIPADQLIP